MTLNELLQNLLYVAITAVLPILTVYITGLLKKNITNIAEQAESEREAEIIYEAGQLIETVVVSINQTIVETAKKKGTFDKSAQKVAKQQAIDKIKELMTDETKKVLDKVYNNYESYIDVTIEAIVNKQK